MIFKRPMVMFFAGILAALAVDVSAQVYNFFPPPGITWNAGSSNLTFTGAGATTISTNGGPTADFSIKASDSGTAGIAGFLNLSGGNGTAGNTSGGAVNILAGNGFGSSSGGSFTIQAGSGGATGLGGSVQLNGGQGAVGGGGQFFIPGGTATALGTAADITLTPASGQTLALSGNIDLQDLNGNNSIQVTPAGLDNITELAASNAATFTVSGCAATAPTGGTWAGTVTSGTTGTCTIVLTPNVPTPAKHGWRCSFDDETTPADRMAQSAHTPTTCTITGTTVSGDVLVGHMTAF